MARSMAMRDIMRYGKKSKPKGMDLSQCDDLGGMDKNLKKIKLKLKK